MVWVIWLHWMGYCLGLLGIFPLIWSLLKQGVSLLGLALLTAGFLLVLITDLIVYHYVEAADFARLLTKFHDLDVRKLVEFQYASGWRVGSIIRLEKKDIDWQRETVKR